MLMMKTRQRQNLVEWRGTMYRLCWLLLAATLLLGDRCFAQEFDKAKSFVLKVFNDTYVIPQNNVRIQNNLKIDNCNMTFTSIIDGSVSERQSCEIRYFDRNRVEGGAGMINIWTANEERRVTVSSLKKKYWAMNLDYDKGKYSDAKIISSLKEVIARCNKQEGTKEDGDKAGGGKAKAVQESPNKEGKTPSLTGFQKRETFAAIYDRNLASKGLAHSVRSAGDDRSTLVINKIRMTEDAINGIMRDGVFLTKLKKIGFKTIKFCEPSFQGGSDCQSFSLN
jgi:hypothetical protein